MFLAVLVMVLGFAVGAHTAPSAKPVEKVTSSIGGEYHEVRLVERQVAATRDARVTKHVASKLVVAVWVGDGSIKDADAERRMDAVAASWRAFPSRDLASIVVYLCADGWRTIPDRHARSLFAGETVPKSFAPWFARKVYARSQNGGDLTDKERDGILRGITPVKGSKWASGAPQFQDAARSVPKGGSGIR